MSYILDALKQSDRSRQLNTTHTMSYSHLNAEQIQSKTWLKYVFMAVAITLLSLLAITFWFNRSTVEPSAIQMTPSSTNQEMLQASENSSPKNAISTVQTPNVAFPKTESQIEKIQPAQDATQSTIVQPITKNEIQTKVDTSRSSLSDLVITPSAQTSANNASTESTAATQTDQTQEVQLTEVVQAPVSESENDFSDYDNYASIRASQKLPELHLDILMYHPNASQRKAYINMQSYTQGEQISEGAQLLEIGEKGVLLRYQGKDFVLSAN